MHGINRKRYLRIKVKSTSKGKSKGKTVSIRVPLRRDGATVLSVMHNKGGTAKSTLAAGIGTELVRQGYSVLYVDLDEQTDLTRIVGDNSTYDATLASLFGISMRGKSRDDLESEIVPLDVPLSYNKMTRARGSDSDSDKLGLISLIPGDTKLPDVVNNCVKENFTEMSCERDKSTGCGYYKNIAGFFKNYLDTHYMKYRDFIIIDTAPARYNLLNKLALSVADRVILPIDGLAAANNIGNEISWMWTYIDNMIRAGERNIHPEALFVLSKYYHESNKFHQKINPEIEKKRRRDFANTNVGKSEWLEQAVFQNSMWQALNGVFGDGVLEMGIPASHKSSTYIPGFGATCDYSIVICRLIEWLADTSEDARSNFFELEYEQLLNHIDLLDEELAKIQMLKKGLDIEDRGIQRLGREERLSEYECGICYTKSLDYERISRHMTLEHGYCPDGDCRFRDENRESLITHFINIHEWIGCPDCNTFATQRENMLKAHMKDAHRGW